MVNDIWPVTVPAACGRKRIAQFPYCPGCNVRDQPYSRINTLNGLREKDVTVSGVVPVFLTVMACTALCIPTTVVWKVMDVGVIVNDCAEATPGVSTTDAQTTTM